MCLNRRDFLILSAGLAVGCAGGPQSAQPMIPLKPATIDAGPAAQFSRDGVYDQFAKQGFFVIRKGDQLIALSSLCTHRRYMLEVSPDESFYCKSHGSCFDPVGKVTEGPAVTNLSKLPTRIDERGHLVILAVA